MSTKTSFKKHSTESIKDFKAIKPFLLNTMFSHIYSYESIDETLAKILDTRASVDCVGIAKHTERPVNIAFRSQHKDDYKTFTVRKERQDGTPLEYHKIRKSLNSGFGIRPDIMIQSYFRSSGRVELACARIIDIYKYIKEHKDTITELTNKEDDTKFIIVPWESIPTTKTIEKDFNGGILSYPGSTEIRDKREDC